MLSQKPAGLHATGSSKTSWRYPPTVKTSHLETNVVFLSANAFLPVPQNNSRVLFVQ